MVPTRRTCVSTTCTNKKRLGLVTVNNCFGRVVDLITVEHTKKNGAVVCNKQSTNVDEGKLFQFKAPCNSTVSIILTDNRFYSSISGAPTDLSGTTCGPRFKPKKLCTTCAPYTFKVVCPSFC
jgi:hypothetical protein